MCSSRQDCSQDPGSICGRAHLPHLVQLHAHVLVKHIPERLVLLCHADDPSHATPHPFLQGWEVATWHAVQADEHTIFCPKTASAGWTRRSISKPGMPQVAQESERRSWSSQRKLAAQHRSLQHAVVAPSGVSRSEGKAGMGTNTCTLPTWLNWFSTMAIRLFKYLARRWSETLWPAAGQHWAGQCAALLAS